MELKNTINAYLRYCSEQKTLNPKTVKAYATDLLQFSSFSGGEFNKSVIINYIAYLHKQFKPKTAKRKIAAVKALAHFLMIQEIIETNPFDKIDTSFREPMMLPKVIPLNIIGKILANAYDTLQHCNTEFSRKNVIRNIAILEILFATGARVSEICSLTPDAVDLTNHGFGQIYCPRAISVAETTPVKS